MYVVELENSSTYMDDNRQSISKNVGLFPQKRADQQSRGNYKEGKSGWDAWTSIKSGGKFVILPLTLALAQSTSPPTTSCRSNWMSTGQCSVNLSIHSVFGCCWSSVYIAGLSQLSQLLSSREIFPKNRQLMEAICPCFRRKWMTINFQNWWHIHAKEWI